MRLVQWPVETARACRSAAAPPVRTGLKTVQKVLTEAVAVTFVARVATHRVIVFVAAD